MDDLKRTVEAILFAAARKLELDEIAKLCRRSADEVRAVLVEWKSELDSSNGPTMLVEDGTGWKLTVREKYIPVIKKVVSKTELPKGHLETLAVVAYKAPVLQSKVIKIRTNKAYDHLNQLEESGFITREKQGRTKLIKLTSKFFEYFDIDPSKLRNKFGNAVDLEKAIEAKEAEIESIEVEQRRQTEEQLEGPQIVLGDGKPLETYPVVEKLDEMLPTGVEVIEEKLDGLEVFDVPAESLPPDERPHPHKKHHKKKAKRHSHDVHHKEESESSESEKVERVSEEEMAEAPVEKEVYAEPLVESEVKPEVSTLESDKVEEEKPEKHHKEKKNKVKKEKAVSEEESEMLSEPEKKEEAKVPVEETPEVHLSPEEKIKREAAEKTKKLKPRGFESGKGLYPKGVPPEMEAKIEEKIKSLLSGEKPDEEKEE